MYVLSRSDLPLALMIQVQVCWEGYASTDCAAGTQIFSQCAREELCQHVDVNESTVQRCLPDQSVEVDLYRGTESCQGEAAMSFNIKRVSGVHITSEGSPAWGDDI
jgi:hypothetical protein